MSKTTQINPRMVQMYDKSVVHEYIKKYQGLIFSYNEVVRTDRISNELILKIDCERIPDRIIFNGREATLIYD